MSFFFWRCHMAFLIWCCAYHFYVSGGNLKTWHVTWFHLLVIRCWHIINWKLIWSQIIDHKQSDGLYFILYFTLYSKNYNLSLSLSLSLIYIYIYIYIIHTNPYLGHVESTSKIRQLTNTNKTISLHIYIIIIIFLLSSKMHEEKRYTIHLRLLTRHVHMYYIFN